MIDSLFSPMWYRVAALRPRLLNHVKVQQRDFRGRVWVTLHDSISGRHHRVNGAAYDIVGRLSGRSSMQEIWDAVLALRGDDAPDQEEVIRMLGRLYADGLIQADTDANIEELFLRQEKHSRQRRLAAVNPLSFRVPMLDPARLLDRVAPWLKPCFSGAGLLLWAACILVALIGALPYFGELRLYGARLLDTRYLLLLIGCYPLVKALHEFGHAIAVRRWGGEVREAGVALIMLMPVPYVDASAASAFRARGQRMVVGGAGIMVELLLAAIALWVWISAQDGWVRDAAFVVVAIGGVSTALFNGNPLMRLDGYYVLCDFLEIPNLAARASQRCQHLFSRVVLRVKPVEADEADRFESWFLPSYALASYCYRSAVSALLVMWISSKSVPLAVCAAVWLLCVLLVFPLLRGARYLLSSPQLARTRLRALSSASAVVLALLALLVLLPLPCVTRAQGVVWQADDALLRVAAAGEVATLAGQDGQPVRAGDLIATLSNPILEADASVLEAKAARLLVRINQALHENTTEWQSLQEQLATVRAQLARAHEELAALQIHAPVDGQLIIPRAADLPGSYLKKGAILGYILSDTSLLIRVAVTQEQAGLIRNGVNQVALRLAEQPARVLLGRVVREVPAATDELHSAALGDRNGGSIRTDPEDKEGVRTLQPVFVFDVAVSDEKPQRLGGRVMLRFDHGAEPALVQAGRALRQLFLRHAQT